MAALVYLVVGHCLIGNLNGCKLGKLLLGASVCPIPVRIDYCSIAALDAPLILILNAFPTPTTRLCTGTLPESSQVYFTKSPHTRPIAMISQTQQ